MAESPESDEKDFKVFNDPVHGTMPMHPLLVRIIDTPQFQRLRHLKQLGGCYFVYPGASHNRFEHCIGVAHLAGKLVKALRRSRSDITDRDVLCVQIAGLCHDLGHGPFSHEFETFIKEKLSERKWKHEEASLSMFDHMVTTNHLEPIMRKYHLEVNDGDDGPLKKPDDLDFIKEMIKGWSPEGQQPLPGGHKPKCRPDQPFLYEIVNNKRNGIDVDKFDYLARDAHHLGIKSSFDHLRFIHFARVCEVKGQEVEEQKVGGKNLQICTRDKEVENLYAMFHLRYLLHSRAYQHKVNKIIETMITEAFGEADEHMSLSTAIDDMEAFREADEHIKIIGKGRKTFTLSTAIDDMEAYTKLTDDVFGQILHSSDSNLNKAREILERIVNRQHDRFLGEVKPTEKMNKDMKSKGEKAMTDEWRKELGKACEDDELTEDDFVVHVVEMNYGMGGTDPMKNMKFYKKNKENRAKLPDDQFDQTSMYLPRRFSEQRIRVYCKKIDDVSLSKARRRMEAWWETKQQENRETRGQAPAGGGGGGRGEGGGGGRHQESN